MPFSNPVFSICIPCYNARKYLVECLQSVTDQSFDNWEIILVDDGSNNDTLDYLHNEAARIPKVRVLYHEQNKGLYAARTTAIKASQGSYLMFLDSDDALVDSHVLGELYDHLQQWHPDILMFNMTNNLSTLKPSIDFKSLGFPKDGLLNLTKVKELFLREYTINNLWNKVYKRDIFKHEQPLQEYMNMCEDRYRFADALFRATSIALYNKVLYYYRVNQDSLSRQSFNNHSFVEQMQSEKRVRMLAVKNGMNYSGQQTRILKVAAADLRASSLDKTKTMVQFDKLVSMITSNELVTEAFAEVEASSLRPDERILIFGVIHHWPSPVIRGLASIAQIIKLAIQR